MDHDLKFRIDYFAVEAPALFAKSQSERDLSLVESLRFHKLQQVSTGERLQTRQALLLVSYCKKKRCSLQWTWPKAETPYFTKMSIINYLRFNDLAGPC